MDFLQQQGIQVKVIPGTILLQLYLAEKIKFITPLDYLLQVSSFVTTSGL